MRKDDSQTTIGIDYGSLERAAVVVFRRLEPQREPHLDFSAEGSLFEKHLCAALQLPKKLLHPETLPTAEEFVEVLREHPELCAEVKRLLDAEDLRRRAEVERLLDAQDLRRHAKPMGGFGTWSGRIGRLQGRHFRQHSQARDDLLTPDVYQSLGLSVGCQKALKLWEEYDQRCELFDRSVCTGGRGRGGEVMPAAPAEHTAINRNAKREWQRVQREAAHQGVSREDLEWAKHSRARNRQHREWLGRLNQTRPR